MATFNNNQSENVDDAVTIDIADDTDTHLNGVWFYHLPSKSYWFWSLDGLTSLMADTNSNNQSRVWAALGADVYYVDDDTYQYDDHDQTQPLTEGQFEVPLMFSPKALDGQGKYIVARAIDAKWGSTENTDPYGQVNIDQVTDVYEGEARALLATREVDIAPNAEGLNEWRSYTLKPADPSQVVGLRFTFSQGEHPYRQFPLAVEAVRVILGKTPLRQRRT